MASVTMPEVIAAPVPVWMLVGAVLRDDAVIIVKTARAKRGVAFNPKPLTRGSITKRFLR
jgi:hypothetical protein